MNYFIELFHQPLSDIKPTPTLGNDDLKEFILNLIKPVNMPRYVKYRLIEYNKYIFKSSLKLSQNLTEGKIECRNNSELKITLKTI